ncbi:hypothetical protein BDV59DRAFT_176161 [Aspergillus ambiguus]|uniref:uncharacterized protein n=1 Tax=Aspergillus ambiguus TaxID=176160 RepID=UPI003CCD6885
MREPKLDPRFEIRRLGGEHIEWAKAIFVHCNITKSSVWSRLQPDDKTKAQLAYQQYQTADHLVRHAILSGISYGVFDREYMYKYPESEASGGKLHWDMADVSATEEQLLQQMDFPLVSIAMSCDNANYVDMKQLDSFISVLPCFGHAVSHMNSLDTRTEEQKTQGRVLQRVGTSTRSDYQQRGLMRTMAYWVMDEAARLGYDAIEIPCVNSSVIRIWGNPPSPYRASILSEFNIRDYEVEEKGVKTKPYRHVDQIMCKIRVELTEGSSGHTA